MNSNIRTTCDCRTTAECRVWGDPHINSFYGCKKRVKVKKGDLLDIYSYKGFKIQATTFGRDLMDNITFGNEFYWHKEDCNNRKKDLSTRTHQFEDGSIITAHVYCNKQKRRKGSTHINIHITKVAQTEYFSDNEIEAGSTGVCLKEC